MLKPPWLITEPGPPVILLSSLSTRCIFDSSRRLEPTGSEVCPASTRQWSTTS